MTFNHFLTWLRHRGAWAITAAIISIPLIVAARGSAAGSDFNIQVSPSPLAITLTPGRNQSVALTVRNFSNHSETLYPSLKGFTVDKNTRNVRLVESAPGNARDWVAFQQPSLVLPAGASGQLITQFDTPQNVGFNYTLALVLSRSQNTAVPSDGISLRGSVAIFCLVNINRPGAKRQFSISNIGSDKGRYNYLPAVFRITIANTGNVIDHPGGTLFIQRRFDDAKPIATLPINSGGNYVLPGTDRVFTATWKDGFPLYVTNSGGKRHLSWDWKRIGQLRFGKYVAKAVIVYNDGQRDVTAINAKTFWVIPWTLILAVLIICIVLVTGVVGWGRLIVKGTKKVRNYAAHRR